MYLSAYSYSVLSELDLSFIESVGLEIGKIGEQIGRIKWNRNICTDSTKCKRIENL